MLARPASIASPAGTPARSSGAARGPACRPTSHHMLAPTDTRAVAIGAGAPTATPSHRPASQPEAIGTSGERVLVIALSPTSRSRARARRRKLLRIIPRPRFTPWRTGRAAAEVRRAERAPRLTLITHGPKIGLYTDPDAYVRVRVGVVESRVPARLTRCLARPRACNYPSSKRAKQLPASHSCDGRSR